MCPRDYAAMTTLITTAKLQSAGTVDYSVAEVDYQIEESLKEFPTYKPHMIPILFKIEGRYGDSTSTSADNLVDTTKGHFLAADSTDEKVIHNRTDSKRAVITSFSSTSQVGIAPDIMTISEHYDIYNKQCWNHRQLYIGDVPEYERVHSVEFPVGTKRNFTRYDRVLEIDVTRIPDTNANTVVVSNLPNEDVLIRFNMPHQLNQLTQFTATISATTVAGATTLACGTMQAAGTVEIGSEFDVPGHRATYIVNAETTIASNTATFSFYPPLEAVANSATVLTFRESSLEPQDEEIFAELVASRLMINKAPKYLNSVNFGGGITYQNFLSAGERRLSETLGKLGRNPPRVKERYPRD